VGKSGVAFTHPLKSADVILEHLLYAVKVKFTE